MRTRGRVVSCVVCLSVCQCVHSGRPSQTLLKLTFGPGKVALVIRPVFLPSTYDSDHSEAQKSVCSIRLNRAFSLTTMNHSKSPYISAPVHVRLLVTQVHRVFSTSKGHGSWALDLSPAPWLAIVVS